MRTDTLAITTGMTTQITPTDSASYNDGYGTCGNCGRSCECNADNVTAGTHTFVPVGAAASNVGPARVEPVNRAERRAEAAKTRRRRRLR